MNRLGRSLLLAPLFGGWLAGNARAATFSVNKITDTADGACDSDCSLREAVIASNLNPGPDTILLPAGTFQLSIPGIFEHASATGDLDVLEGLTMSGAGAAATVIDGGGIDQVVQVLAPPAAVVTFSDLTIQNGSSFNDGGGIQIAGAIVNVVRSVIQHNSTAGGGGGIANDDGFLVLTDTVVRDNRAAGGGGISNGSGALNVLRSRILDNRVSLGAGGGILNSRGPLTVVSSTLAGNFAGGTGGGISSSSGTFPENHPQTLRDSTISGNSTDSAGGGLFAMGAWIITNSTFSGNRATGIGGGMRATGGFSSILYGTLTLNTAGVGGGVSVAVGASLSLGSTIVADSPSGGNCDGSITSAGYNLSSDASCETSFSSPTDRNGTPPLLGPLADGGGLTQTHALLPGSPAIDTAAPCPPPTTDQRGISRPQGSACDVGSFEVESGILPAGIPTLSVAAMVVLTLVLAVAGGWIARR